MFPKARAGAPAVPTPAPTQPRRRRRWRGLRIVAALLGVFLIYLVALQLTGNFHAIIPGQAYRAAQVDPARLKRWQDKAGIASVLNLRGTHPGTDWYDAELAGAEALGMTHLDFRMSSAEVLTADEAHRLIAIMRDAPKPILIHCKAGADRTGLAAALYVAAIAGGGEYKAEYHLSPIFGHIALPFSRSWAMNQTWERLEGEMGFPGS